MSRLRRSAQKASNRLAEPKVSDLALFRQSSRLSAQGNGTAKAPKTPSATRQCWSERKGRIGNDMKFLYIAQRVEVPHDQSLASRSAASLALGNWRCVGTRAGRPWDTAPKSWPCWVPSDFGDREGSKRGSALARSRDPSGVRDHGMFVKGGPVTWESHTILR